MGKEGHQRGVLSACDEQPRADAGECLPNLDGLTHVPRRPLQYRNTWTCTCVYLYFLSRKHLAGSPVRTVLWAHRRARAGGPPFQLSPEIHSFFPPPPPRPPARQGRKQSGQQLFVQCDSTTRGCRREGGGGRGRRVLPPALNGRDASNGRHPRGPFRVRPPGDSPPDFDPRFTRCHAAAGGGGAATLRQGRGSGTRRCP